jgi:hypothetical protein
LKGIDYLLGQKIFVTAQENPYFRIEVERKVRINGGEIKQSLTERFKPERLSLDCLK